MSDCQTYDQPAIYQIKVKGKLDPQWADWFNGLELTHLPNYETLLKGLITDQTALHSLIVRIRDLSLPILLIERLHDNQT